jgi:hypothetical protein
MSPRKNDGSKRNNSLGMLTCGGFDSKGLPPVKHAKTAVRQKGIWLDNDLRVRMSMY